MFKQRVLRNLDKRSIFYYVIHPVRYELQIQLWNLLPFLPHFIIFNYVPFCYCDLKNERFYFFPVSKISHFPTQDKGRIIWFKAKCILNNSMHLKESHCFFSVIVLSVKFLCPPSRPHRCRNDRICLQLEKTCNGINDCGDNSDEDHCNGKSVQLELLIYKQVER